MFSKGQISSTDTNSNNNSCSAPKEESSQKNIKQIIIYNRTDCCVNRLSNYQVSTRARLAVPTPTAITTVAVPLKKKGRPDAVTVWLFLKSEHNPHPT
jgi:hypothetical protein